MTAPESGSAAPDTTRDGAGVAGAGKHQRYSDTTTDMVDASPLDRQIPVTTFPDQYAKARTPAKVSMRGIARSIVKRRAPAKARLPWLKLAITGNSVTEKGSYRHNANVLAITGIEGDYDREMLSVRDTKARLLRADIAALIYTTASHRPNKPRYRILCPTSRPLDPHHRAGLVARLNGVLDGQLAGESFTLSQAYYYGGIEGEQAPETELVEGRYIDLADDLDAKALDKKGKPWGEAPPLLQGVAEDDGELRGEPDVEEVRAALLAIPEEAMEGYHDWLRIGMALHGGFNGSEEGRDLWHEAAERANGYDWNELDEKWASFGRGSGKHLGIGTIFALAREHGWNGKAEKPKADHAPLRFLSTEECAVAPSRGYVVKGMIAPGDVASIFGAPSAGKSLLGPYLGYQVALGESVFGMRTKPGTVFYVAAEDPTGMQMRIHALARRQGHAPGFLFTPSVSDLFSEDSDDLDMLAEAVDRERPSLIFIDTLAMAFPGLEENDAASMGKVVAVGRRLAKHGSAVIFIHHDTKDEGLTPRGHSVFNGALDMALYVKRGDDGIVRCRLTKNRNGSPDRDIAFRIGIEELGIDEDDDAITAAIVEELTSSLVASKRDKPPKSEVKALSVFHKLAEQGSVTLEAWWDACTEQGSISTSSNRASRRTAASRATEAILERGTLILANGIVTEADADGFGDDL